MTTINPNPIQLDKSQSNRQPTFLGNSQPIDKSISIKPAITTNLSISQFDLPILPLNQMQSVDPVSKSQQESNVMALLQNAKTPAPVINEKLQRCSDFKLGKFGPIPTCFRENSPKEELVLEHVIQYKRQFQLVYENEERELFLYPKNECDVYKVIKIPVSKKKNN